jgi:hypothetical protein
MIDHHPLYNPQTLQRLFDSPINYIFNKIKDITNMISTPRIIKITEILSLESKLNHHISNAMTTLEFQFVKELCILGCAAGSCVPLSEDAYNTAETFRVNCFS